MHHGFACLCSEKSPGGACGHTAGYINAEARSIMPHTQCANFSLHQKASAMGASWSVRQAITVGRPLSFSLDVPAMAM
jgi:hypothetical protein